MSLIERILARASSQREVVPGQIVDCKVDVAMVNEITGGLLANYFREVGATKVWDPEHAVVVIDHTVPAPTPEAADLHRLVRDFAYDAGMRYFYDVGRGGICHQIMVEKGHIKPGDVAVGADSHSCTYGALGAFATGIGSTEMTAVFITGRLWFKIPGVYRISVEGALNEYVTPKDVMLKIAQLIGFAGATYKGLEFTGSTIRNMEISGRMTLCNMTIELGGKAGIIEADDKTVAYIRERTSEPFTLVKGDPNASYEKSFEIDATTLTPLVACPDSVDNVKPVGEVEGIELNQIFIGSCTNGRLEDLQAAAQILKGRKVNRNTRLIVVPASQQVYLEAIRQGVVETLLTAGAVIASSTCGACYGGHMGVLGPGQVCLSTTNRNFIGRMGSSKAHVYLASPYTAAASAIYGKISDPSTLKR